MNVNAQISSFYENGQFQDFYKILEVNSKATIDEIKQNYHRLSRIYHPDSKTGDESKMKRLGIAYGVLKNEEMRNLYDSYYLSAQKRNSYSNCAFTSGSSSNSNTTSNFTQSENCTSYFSWNQIRVLLKKCKYSETEIDGFISWCQKNYVSISSGSELCSIFSKYHSLYFKNDMKESHNNYSQEETFYHKFKVPSFKYSLYPSVCDSIFYRQSVVREMLMTSFLRDYLGSFLGFISPISNLQIYGLHPVRVTLTPYIPVTKIIFYERPMVKYYY